MNNFYLLRHRARPGTGVFAWDKDQACSQYRGSTDQAHNGRQRTLFGARWRNPVFATSNFTALESVRPNRCGRPVSLSLEIDRLTGLIFDAVRSEIQESSGRRSSVLTTRSTS